MAVRSASPLDDEAQDDAASRPGLPLDPWRVWLSIKRSWKLLPAAVAFGALAGALVAVFFVSPTFRSEGVLIWEPEGGSARPDRRDLSTQAGVLTTRVVLEGVRKRLKQEAPIELISEQIGVWFDEESNLVRIETTGETAKGAYNLADALIESFLEHQRALSRTRTRELIGSLMTDAKEAARLRDEAQATYDAFRAAHGIGDFEFDSQRALEALESLRAQANTAQADVGALDARAEQLDALARSQPRTRTQSAMRSDPGAERVAALKAELAVSRARLAPDHPRLALLSAQLAQAEKFAATGSSVVSNVTTVPDPAFELTQSSLATARAERAGAAQRKEELQEAISKAEARVNAFTAVAGEARKLLAQVAQTAERAQELGGRLNRAQEAERASPAVAFRMLAPPVVPEYPQESKRKVVVVAVIMLSTMVCVAFLVLRPVRDGRIHTAREAAFWARVPVVGMSSWPGRAQSFRALVDELNDRAARATGSTLVVASRPEDRALAAALAAFLGPHPVPISFTVLGDANVPEAQSTALAVRHVGDSAFFAWPGESDGPTLRRAARISDRVLVVMRARGEPMLQAASLRTRLGRETNVAVVLVDVADELLALPDRVGDIDRFWWPSTQPA